jgi:hypothetical protein
MKTTRQAKRERLPRYWKKTIACITGLVFCDRDCGCGENNRLWWLPCTTGETRKEDAAPFRGDRVNDHEPAWVPGWMNGGDTHEIWKWLVKNKRT